MSKGQITNTRTDTKHDARDGNRMKEEKIRWQKLMKTTGAGDTYIWSHSSHRVSIMFFLS